MPTTCFELPRAYRFKLAPELNAGKRAQLEALHSEWRRMLPLAFDWFWAPFLRGGLLPKNPARSGPKSTFPVTRLVTSQKDLMAVAVEGQAKSWVSNLKNRLARALMQNDVLARDTNLRRQLLWLNAMKAWLLPYPQQVALLATAPKKADTLTVLTPAASRTMRKMVRRYIDLHRLPDPLQLPLQVNQLSAVMAPAVHTTSFWANAWLRVSTLVRGQKLELPVMANAYAAARGGRRALTFALVPDGADWYVVGTQYLTPAPWASSVGCRTPVLGIDLGLRNLMSSSEGDVLGSGFLAQLQRYDAQLQSIQKGLQGAGQVRLARCRRYRVLVSRLRGFLKTTLQTHLKRLLDIRRPAKVVIEDLLFTGQPGTLSRRMNRLLRRFGQRYFSQTLAERQGEFGFELEVVNPAYSSQTCHRCGFVHRDNRRGDEFKCQACGHRAHADVNAAKNLARRSGAGLGKTASSAPAGLRGLWAQILHGWLERQRAILVERGTSGLPVSHRAVGSARAGLLTLVRKKSSASRLSAERRKAMLSAATSPTLEGLLNGLVLQPSDLLKVASTR